jgi:Tfp pilus tip-associated adhesin PilY1
VRPSSLRILSAALAVATCLVRPAAAEDIDLFTNPAANATTAPNVLIIIDNSANWARNDQAWVGGKQGEAELNALSTLMDDPNVNTGLNIGLMMFTSGSPDGAYVRYAVRGMTPANKAAFKEMIGAATCTASNNTLMGTPNCILANFNSATEKTNSASTVYSAAIFEAFKYFGGYTDPARANLDVAGTPVDSTHFGNLRYSVLDSKADPGAFTDAGKTTYRSPINADGSNSCAKNYVIFIGNGYPSQDVPDSLLTGINGNASVPPGMGNKGWKTANWTKYLNTTDVNPLLGRQSVSTYTIDVYNAKPDASNQGALLQAMAKYAGGKYFAATNQQAILDALKDILVEIQAVNSVFASASLPINATNRSQNENQVFIGMFRPDPDALPRWYGNLKQYQIALFGVDAKLADKDGKEALAATTGFVQGCATSFWTTDSGTYWSFSAPSAGTCTSAGTSLSSDAPDGSIVEKGGAAEVVRRGNSPGSAMPVGGFTVNRTMYTCAGSICSSLVAFNDTNVTMARTGAATAAINTSIVDYAFGKDVNDENGDANKTEPRPSIHADIAHSRPLPVNFGGTRGVNVYYGANDGPFRAVDGKTGKELWSFVAPEHHAKLKRLYSNAPLITYPNMPTGLTTQSKDYFFDGSSGIYQNADNSQVWIYPTMRRGGRMIYGFDVSTTTPVLKWARGCPNAGDDTGCSSGWIGIGQTWSVPNLAFVKGFSSTIPLAIVGGGYDACEDTDAIATTCITPKGAKVYIVNSDTGAIEKSFDTDRSVAADVTLIDRDFDGKVDHAYVADTGGSIYRIDFVDPTTLAQRASSAWTMTKIARTTGGGRKFLFGPSAAVIGSKVFLAIGSGDRERPLISNYPYTASVQNRFYSIVDTFSTTLGLIDLDGSSVTNVTSGSDCSTTLATGQNGWFMDLNAGRGEQTVTSSVIFGGTAFFSTNRPIAAAPGTCSANLGEARGYAVNLLNGSGVIGTGKLCGGTRSGVFVGGGIPPSPVVGTVPIVQADGSTKPTNILIGGINLQTGSGSPIGAQAPPIPIKQIRSRLYWYPDSQR